MNLMATARKALFGLGATATLTVAMLAGTAGPAAAAPMGKGRVMLCSEGSYGSYLNFMGSHSTTTLVSPGHCLAMNIPFGTGVIEVLGQWHTSPNTFSLGGFFASQESNPGFKVYTRGSTGNAAATAHFVLRRD